MATLSAAMPSIALYTSLSDKEGSEQDQTAGFMSETPLLDEYDQVSNKKRRKWRRYGHWIVYFGSVIAMSGMLLQVQQSFQKHQCKCWDRFNYYCKRVS